MFSKIELINQEIHNKIVSFILSIADDCLKKP